MNSYLKVGFIDGRKQEPKDLDFNITPTLTFANDTVKSKKGYALAIEWGYWAVCLMFIFSNDRVAEGNSA